MKTHDPGHPVRKKQLWLVPVALILLFGIAFLIYTAQYYHADGTAHAALKSDETVTVTQTDYGWLFDGPSEADALIFYPGAKVEETAYAPLLHRFAERGLDVCLVRMPLRLAVFGMNKADHVMARHDYARWYIGGHSLGGAIAAGYAAAHSDQLSGVYMLAAYPVKPLGKNIRSVILYGSEDRILNRTKLEESYRYLPGNSVTFVVEGGNHAQFGNYGRQDGDGEAVISAEEQQRRALEWILANR